MKRRDSTSNFITYLTFVISKYTINRNGFKILRSGLTCVAVTVLLLSLVVSNPLYNQMLVLAQNTTTASSSINNTSSNSTTAEHKIDTFRAKGQISSLVSDALLGDGTNKTSSNSSDTGMWVLGGNWGFNVVTGNLANFNVDIKMTMIDGTATHHHSIEQIKNASGNYTIGSDKKIVLNGNSTKISGIADITTNGKVKWKDVPINVSILNGNILNISIDPLKTDYHFKGLPIYGTANSIIGGTGQELLLVWFAK